MVEWANTVIAVAGIFLAVIALLQTRRSNRAAAEANTISRGANELSGNANRVAERALQLQEEDGKVRLVVKPRIMMTVTVGEHDEDDHKPRPVVEVVNLSAFPVTITGIHWKRVGDERDGKGFFYWKNPTITDPFGKLPARLPARESLTALGTPSTWKTVDDLASVSAAIVYTACGEQFEGMTDQWKQEVARMVGSGRSNGSTGPRTEDVAGV